MSSSYARFQPVILSGGSGMRLWPLSSEERPKQFLSLAGGRTMLQITVARTFGQSEYKIPFIVGNARHSPEIKRQLAAIGAGETALILEPAARNTAGAMGLAALRADPTDLLLVMPSDHVIAAPDRFLAAVRTAAAPASDGYLVTFGIEPDRPETGYGYIK
ncbi:MAG TPA: sugar phosphate nucleotidyltransferase, partial [Bryobacteraceae bacterium]|nr:sugar phosphate nucleotidyltransferase [Bryobacteraceae bacterium]